MKQSRVLGVCLVVLVAMAVVMAAPPGKKLTVREINAAIKAQGSGWVAVANKFTRMTNAERKALLGALPPEISGSADRSVDQGKPGSDLPTSFDWRNQNGINWMTPVKDQGTCSAGWAFGTVAALEAKIQIYFSNPYLSPDLAEQFLVSCDKWNFGCSGGSSPNRIYGFIQDYGVPDEGCFPYQAADVSCAGRCSDWASRVHKIEAWKRVCNNKVNTDNVKSAVYTNGPLTCYMDVYEDFYSYGSGCYEHVAGAYLGGHMVCIVGWTLDGWIVKNSWGTGWGEQGYFQIKFGDCRIGTDSGKLIYAGN